MVYATCPSKHQSVTGFTSWSAAVLLDYITTAKTGVTTLFVR